MAKGRQLGALDPKLAKTLQDHIQNPPLGVQYPIRLTAQNSYVSGLAALVFVSSHLLIPADDVASFGTASLSESEGQAFDFTPPYEGARIVAWFRPPEENRTYNIDFSIIAGSGQYTLESKGETESTHVPAAEELDWDKHLSTNFHVTSSDWLPLTLSGDNHWELKSCDINLLP